MSPSSTDACGADLLRVFALPMQSVDYHSNKMAIGQDQTMRCAMISFAFILFRPSWQVLQ